MSREGGRSAIGGAGRAGGAAGSFGVDLGAGGSGSPGLGAGAGSNLSAFGFFFSKRNNEKCNVDDDNEDGGENSCDYLYWARPERLDVHELI